ncbi:hypothetical protein [Streptomyces sp. NPDC058614]|uniref:hypothetical protein n=1 Tax=Streptomyces sp. NPDC058614 TaxID=3346557 RepID=UPI003656D009
MRLDEARVSANSPCLMQLLEAAEACSPRAGRVRKSGQMLRDPGRRVVVSRASTRQLEKQESTTHRAELKNVILKFLSIASQVEKAALTIPRAGVSAADPVIDRFVADLWPGQRRATGDSLMPR